MNANQASPTSVLRLDRSQAMSFVNLAVKIALVAAFFVAIVIPPDAVAGKGMGFRAPLFLGPAFVVPLVARQRDWHPLPHTADALVSMPFLLDTLGNLFGFYERFERTDDLLHLVNWVLLVMAFHAFRFRNVHDGRDAVLLGYGFGALAIVWWEILEWVVSDEGLGGADGLSLTYGDTIGDLLLSSTGGLIGSVLGLVLLGPDRETRPGGSGTSRH